MYRIRNAAKLEEAGIIHNSAPARNHPCALTTSLLSLSLSSLVNIFSKTSSFLFQRFLFLSFSSFRCFFLSALPLRYGSGARHRPRLIKRVLELSLYPYHHPKKKSR